MMVVESWPEHNMDMASFDKRESQIKTLIDRLLVADDKYSVIRAANEAFGTIIISQMIPRLWEVLAFRPAILNHLLWNAQYNEFLYRSRDLIRQNSLSGGPELPWTIEIIAHYHLALGAGEELLLLLSDYPDLRNQWKRASARLLAGSGKTKEALEILADADKSTDYNIIFAAGWLEFHFGSHVKAKQRRAQIDSIVIEDAKILLSVVTSENAAISLIAGQSIHDALPYTRNRIANIDPEIASTVAARVYDTLLILHPQTIGEENQDALFVPDVQVCSKDTLSQITARGMNPFVLKLLGSLCETNEIIASSVVEQRKNAHALKRLDDSDFFKGFWAIPAPVDPHHVIDIFRGVDARGGLVALCPRSLESKVSTESYFWHGLFCYRFEGSNEFWLIGGTYFTRGWYWEPASNILIGLCPASSASRRQFILDELIEFMEFLVENEFAVRNYRQKVRRLGIVSGLMSHIGHHYHNELAGMHRLRENRLLDKAHVQLSGPNDFYKASALMDFQPEKTIEFCSDEDLTRLILDEGLFAVWPTDRGAPVALGKTIVRYSKTEVLSPEANTLATAASEADLVIIWGLRTKQRVWLDGIDAACEIILRLNKLVVEFGIQKLIVIFDGYTRTDPATDNQAVGIAQEQALVGEIRTRTETRFLGRLETAIGFDVYEKALVFTNADVAVCTKGMGHQPTLSWVTRTPSIVHSNSCDISGAIFENMFCETGSPLSVIGRPGISDNLSDLPCEYRWRPEWGHLMQADYSLNREEVWAALERLVSRAILKRACRKSENFTQ